MRTIILSKDKKERGKTFLRVAALVLALRMIVFAYAWVVFRQPQSGNFHSSRRAAIRTVPPAGESFEDFLRIWRRWDGQAYIEIATYGYDGKSLNDDRRTFNSRFPPLYPLLIRAAAVVSPFELWKTAIIVSILLLIAASYLLFRLVEYETLDRNPAWWAVIFLNTFPASYFANAVYAESLFLVLSFLYLGTVRRTGRLSRETLFLMLMLLTRQVAMAIMPFHMCRALRRAVALRSQPLHACWSIVLGALPLVVYASFILYTQQILHLPGYRAASNQRLEYVFPFSETAWALVRMILHPEWQQSEYFLFTEGWPSMFLALTVLFSISAAFFVPFEYTVFAFSYLALLSVVHWNIGAHRYCFGLATLPIALVSVFRNVGRPAVLVFFLLFSGVFIEVYIRDWLLM